MKIAGWERRSFDRHEWANNEGSRPVDWVCDILDIAERALKLLAKSRKLRYCPPEPFPEVKELLADSNALLAECAEEDKVAINRPCPQCDGRGVVSAASKTCREEVEEYLRPGGRSNYEAFLYQMADRLDALEAKS